MGAHPRHQISLPERAARWGLTAVATAALVAACSTTAPHHAQAAHPPQPHEGGITGLVTPSTAPAPPDLGPGATTPTTPPIPIEVGIGIRPDDDPVRDTVFVTLTNTTAVPHQVRVTFAYCNTATPPACAPAVPRIGLGTEAGLDDLGTGFDTTVQAFTNGAQVVVTTPHAGPPPAQIGSVKASVAVDGRPEIVVNSLNG